MNIIKKSLLVLTIISTTANVLPRGGGAAFWTGAAIGTGVALAATSGRRYDEYPENRRIGSIEREIKRIERQIDSLQRKIDKIKYKNKNRKKNKGMSENEKNNKLADLQNRLDEHKANINNLRRERAMVTA